MKTNILDQIKNSEEKNNNRVIAKNVSIDRGILRLNEKNIFISSIAYIDTLPASKISYKNYVRNVAISAIAAIIGLAIIKGSGFIGVLIFLIAALAAAYYIFQILSIQKENESRKYSTGFHLNNGLTYIVTHDWREFEGQVIEAIKQTNEDSTKHIVLYTDGERKMEVTNVYNGPIFNGGVNNMISSGDNSPIKIGDQINNQGTGQNVIKGKNNTNDFDVNIGGIDNYNDLLKQSKSMDELQILTSFLKIRKEEVDSENKIIIEVLISDANGGNKSKLKDSLKKLGEKAFQGIFVTGLTESIKILVKTAINAIIL